MPLSPYVNRATNLLGNGLQPVNYIRRVVDETKSGTEIIAASIKSMEEAVDTLFAGAHHLTLPLALLTGDGREQVYPASDPGFQFIIHNQCLTQ